MKSTEKLNAGEQQNILIESTLNVGYNPMLVTGEGLGTQEDLQTGGALLITLDTRANLLRFPGFSNSSLPETAILEYEQEISAAMQIAFRDVAPVVITKEESFYQAMSSLLEKSVNDAREMGARVVNLDRFIESGNVQPGQDYTNISVGRTITKDGIIIDARPGEFSLKEQLSQLRIDMQNNGQTKLIIVDDGLFDIECLETYESIFDGFQIAGYYVGVGPYGDGELNTIPYLQSQGKIVEAVLPANNFKDWVCSRDYAPWGGKLTQSGDSNYFTIPYFAPFSDGSAASIPPERLILVSRAILTANLRLFRSLEQSQNRQITFTDFAQAGYGLPTSNTGMMRRAESNESVANYLAECLITLDSDYPSSNLDSQSPKGVSPLNSLTRTRLELLDSRCGDKLIILVGSSGTGRSTIARGLTDTRYFTRLKRDTTRSLRSQAEADEITQVDKESFLQRYANPNRSDQIIAAVKYAANDQLYGVSLKTIQELSKLSLTQFAVVEGTGDVLSLKQLLPSAQVIMVLPPSIESLGSRLTDRGDTDTKTRLDQSKHELSETLKSLPDLVKTGLVDLVITNNDVDTSVDAILNYLSNQEK